MSPQAQARREWMNREIKMINLEQKKQHKQHRTAYNWIELSFCCLYSYSIKAKILIISASLETNFKQEMVTLSKLSLTFDKKNKHPLIYERSADDFQIYHCH